mgnify:CR=1 FL=1
MHGDTDKVQMGMGTYGSRSGAVGMSAIVKALDKVEAKAKKIAAHLMEADESDIVIDNGELKVAGTDKSVPWFQVALAAYTAHNLPSGMEPVATMISSAPKALASSASSGVLSSTFTCSFASWRSNQSR